MKRQITARSRQTSRVAAIRVHRPHVATIGYEPMASILDTAVYDDVARLHHVPPLTLRELISSMGQVVTPGRPVEIPIGILPLVVAMLRSANWQAKVREQTPLEGLNLYPHRQPEDADWNCPELLRRAYRRICTLAAVPKELDRLQILAALREQYHEAHILIVAKNKAMARSIAAVLRRLTGKPVTHGIQPRECYPWTHVDCISTFVGRSCEHWLYVVFWDAELVVSETAIEQLDTMIGSKRIGFLVRDERRLNERDRAIIECMFGPVVYRAGQITGGTEVGVAWLSPDAYPRRQRTDPLTRKRQHLWQNVARNRLIAKAALALAGNDQDTLKQCGLEEASDWMFGSAEPFGLTVAIVVENAEHGRELAGLLPGWQLKTAIASVNNESEWVLGGQTVVTLRRASTTVVNAGAIIYAAGIGDQWLSNLGPHWVGFSGDRMLVIDVADDYDERMINEWAHRAANYCRYGWRMLGFDSTVPIQGDGRIKERRKSDRKR